MRNKISVCLASYNGEKYISRQLDTILANLSEQDELIVSDDGSRDHTISILQDYAAKYPQIRILSGPRQGVIKNFEHAIANVSGDLIFLSDQDDLWMPDKVEQVEKCFQDTAVTCVVHDADVIDDGQKVLIPSFFEFRNSGPGVVKNIWKNSYIGCCMAFRKELVRYILPIPANIHMHDQWIGILSDHYGKSIFLKKNLIHYRRHEGNVTDLKHSSVSEMVKNRMILMHAYRKRIRDVEGNK